VSSELNEFSVKEIKKENISQTEFEKFLEEAEIMSSLQPHVSVIDSTKMVISTPAQRGAVPRIDHESVLYSDRFAANHLYAH
jgi:hypothetical protein